MSNIRKKILNDLKYKAAALPYKSNKVRMAGGMVTSDLARREAVVASIVATKLNREINDTVRVTFSALKSNFKDSHIGLYYEYGTGDKASGDYSSLKGIPHTAGQYNQYRTGRTIVSRSKHINYAGLGKGKWYDMGGNIRVTGSPKAGVHDAKFRDYIGEDVSAAYWFRDTMQSEAPYIRKQLSIALKSIELKDYFKMPTKIILGKD